MSESNRTNGGQAIHHTNLVTQFIKVNQSIVEFELHTLTEDRIKHDLKEWPANCHVEEIQHVLQPILQTRLQKAGKRWTCKRNEIKITKPILVTTDTMRLAYSFKNTRLHMHCLLQAHGQYKGFRMFGEKIIVYACPLPKATNMAVPEEARSKNETTSAYFTKPVCEHKKKILKLSRPQGRKRPPRKPSPEKLGESSLAVSDLRDSKAGKSGLDPDFGNQVDWKTSEENFPLSEFLDDTMDLPSASFVQHTPVRVSKEEVQATLSQAVASLPNSPEPQSHTMDSGMDIILGADAIANNENHNLETQEYAGGRSIEWPDVYTRRSRGRWKRMLELLDEEEDKEEDQQIGDNSNPSQSNHSDSSGNVCLETNPGDILPVKLESRSNNAIESQYVNSTKSMTTVRQTYSKPFALRKPSEKRKSTDELLEKGTNMQLLSVTDTLADVCKIDNMEKFMKELDTGTPSVEEELKSVKNASDLTLAQVTYLVTKHETNLLAIFQGKKQSRRHQHYKTGGKERHLLKYQIPMGCFTDEQHDTIMELLLTMFCRKHNKYLDYVLKVMLPEALILIYADVHQTTEARAEKMLTLPTPTVNLVL